MTIVDEMAEVRAALQTLLDAPDDVLALLYEESEVELVQKVFKRDVLVAHLQRVNAAEAIGNFLVTASRTPP